MEQSITPWVHQIIGLGTPTNATLLGRFFINQPYITNIMTKLFIFLNKQQQHPKIHFRSQAIASLLCLVIYRSWPVIPSPLPPQYLLRSPTRTSSNTKSLHIISQSDRSFCQAIRFEILQPRRLQASHRSKLASLRPKFSAYLIRLLLSTLGYYNS